MPEERKLRFGIAIDPILHRQWSIGICISRNEGELYLFMNLIKISVSIGRLYKYEEVEDDD